MTIETGLSDFHKMTITIMKRYFKKNEPITIEYRDLKNFDPLRFREDLRNQLESKENITIEEFQQIFLSVWNAHAPVKRKVVRGNNAPFMNKKLSKAFMTRARLKRIPYYTKLTWVPFCVRFINVDLINVFFCQNCILVYIN